VTPLLEPFPVLRPGRSCRARLEECDEDGGGEMPFSFIRVRGGLTKARSTLGR
jgi:hypothetical protein